MDRFAADVAGPEFDSFAHAVLSFKMKFVEMMDDDFNTAGAIAVMHELAGEINSYMERQGVEQNKRHDLLQAAAAAAQSLRKLGLVLGLFRPGFSKTEFGSNELTEGLMKLLIDIRARERKEKNFALADSVRKGLEQIGVTLEDRPEGTIWRKD